MYFFLGYLLVVNILTFVIYGLDKRSAKRGGRRVSENNLLFLAFAGGTPAAYAARAYFRHKTIKRPFIIYLRYILILHIAVLLLALFFLSRAHS